MEPGELVRRGYDAASYAYRADDAQLGGYASWIGELDAALATGSDVLDLGCGCGVPVARALSRGHRVTGVDLSPVQIARARELVPDAAFQCADLRTIAFAPSSFDAVVALYSLIHVPVDEQPALMARIRSWLRPGGRLLVTTGHRAWTGTEEDWLGSGAPMYWSHADSQTSRGWIEAAGLRVEDERFVAEGDSGGHTLFLAQRRLG